MLAVNGPAINTSVESLTVGPGPVTLTLQPEVSIQCAEDFDMLGDGRLSLEVSDASSASSSRILATENATLSGEFEIVALDGFVPLPGQVYTVVSAEIGSVTGEVDPLDAAFAYSVDYTLSAMNVTILPQPGEFSAVASIVDCMAGTGAIPVPEGPATPNGCVTAFDADGDADVDLADYAAQELLLTSD